MEGRRGGARTWSHRATKLAGDPIGEIFMIAADISPNVRLLDIAPPEVTKEEVDIRGTKLVLRGITNPEMARLYKRFPVFARQIAGEARRQELLAMPTPTATQAAEI